MFENNKIIQDFYLEMKNLSDTDLELLITKINDEIASRHVNEVIVDDTYASERNKIWGWRKVWPAGLVKKDGKYYLNLNNKEAVEWVNKKIDSQIGWEIHFSMGRIKVPLFFRESVD
jgi:hypothetical protein